jgi:hypothetical protein
MDRSRRSVEKSSCVPQRPLPIGGTLSSTGLPKTGNAAQVHRSRSRCALRGSPDGGEVGPPPRILPRASSCRSSRPCARSGCWRPCQAERSRVLDASRQTDLAQQRPPAIDFPGVRGARTASRDVAHLPAHVLVVVTRQGRAGQGGRAADGTRNVDTTLNVYTQVLDGSLRAAVEAVGTELFTIVHKPEEADALTH